MRERRLDAYLPIIGVIGLIVIWYLAVWYEVVDKVLLPSPTDTFRALWKGLTGGALGFDFWRTVERTTAATLIAAAIAIPGIFDRRAIFRRVAHKVDYSSIRRSSSFTRSDALFQRASRSRATWRFCGSTTSYLRPAGDARRGDAPPRARKYLRVGKLPRSLGSRQPVARL